MRHEFALGLALSAGLLAASGCGDEVGPALSTCATLGPFVVIVDNHLPAGGDHRLVVPPEDVRAGVEKVYDIRGDNVGHTHTVTVTAAHFDALAAGDPVSITSSNNGPVGIGHDHLIQLSCP